MVIVIVVVVVIVVSFFLFPSFRIGGTTHTTITMIGPHAFSLLLLLSSFLLLFEINPFFVKGTGRRECRNGGIVRDRINVDGLVTHLL